MNLKEIEEEYTLNVKYILRNNYGCKKRKTSLRKKFQDVQRKFNIMTKRKFVIKLVKLQTLPPLLLMLNPAYHLVFKQ